MSVNTCSAVRLACVLAIFKSERKISIRWRFVVSTYSWGIFCHLNVRFQNFHTALIQKSANVHVAPHERGRWWLFFEQTPDMLWLTSNPGGCCDKNNKHALWVISFFCKRITREHFVFSRVSYMSQFWGGCWGGCHAKWVHKEFPKVPTTSPGPGRKNKHSNTADYVKTLNAYMKAVTE